MTQVLVLADDLTGALEVGAVFAGRGLPALVTTETELDPPGVRGRNVVHVIDTETRHVSPADAFRIVHAIARAARAQGFRYIYKKTDSTLRGNISVELGAVAAAFPDFPLIYSPAYPTMGRTVVEGRLCVDGVPVSETRFSTDGLNPVRESHIPTLLKSSVCGIGAHSIRTEALRDPLPPGVHVLDSNTEEELQSSAQVFAKSSQLRLAAGPTGFARYLVDAVDLTRSAPPPMPRPASCLVINGSRHAVSTAQIQYVERLGWPTVPAGAVAQVETGSGWFLMQNPMVPALAGPDFALRIGESVHHVLRLARFDAMVVFGGDTIYGIVKAIGLNRMWPVGEVLTGVPAARFDPDVFEGIGGSGEGSFHLITKAGGFGAPELLLRVREKLSLR